HHRACLRGRLSQALLGDLRTRRIERAFAADGAVRGRDARGPRAVGDGDAEGARALGRHAPAHLLRRALPFPGARAEPALSRFPPAPRRDRDRGIPSLPAPAPPDAGAPAETAAGDLAHPPWRLSLPPRPAAT